MTVTLQQLLVAVTADQEKARLLGGLSGVGFPVTDWEEGGIERTLVESDAAALSDLSALIPSIASGGFLSTSTGDWLTLLAHEIYEIDRNAAIPTIGTESLYITGSAGPYTIVPGQLSFKGAGGNVYTNTTGGALKPPGFSVVTHVGAALGLVVPTASALFPPPPPGFVTGWRNADQNGKSYLITITGTGAIGVGTFILQYVDANGNTSTSGIGPYPVLVGTTTDPLTGMILTFNNNGGSFTAGDTYSFSAGGQLDVTVQSQFANDSANGRNYIDPINSITNFVTPLPGVTINNRAPIISAVTHAGSGTGLLTPEPISTPLTAIHAYSVTISLGGAPGTAQATYSIDGGASSVPFTIPASGFATTPLPIGDSPHNIRLQFSLLSEGLTYATGDVYTFTVPGTWVIQQGTDVESDAALAGRCAARWPALGNFPTQSVYALMARTVSPQITRVQTSVDIAVNDQINVVIAGQAGPVSGALINQVQDFLNRKAGMTDIPVVSTVATVAITLVLNRVQYHRAANFSALYAAAFAAVSNYLNSLALGPSVVRVVDVLSAIATGAFPGQPVANPVLVSGIADVFGSDGTPATFKINAAAMNFPVTAGLMATLQVSDFIPQTSWIPVA